MYMIYILLYIYNFNNWNLSCIYRCISYNYDIYNYNYI